MCVCACVLVTRAKKKLSHTTCAGVCVCVCVCVCARHVCFHVPHTQYRPAGAADNDVMTMNYQPKNAPN